MMGDPMGDQPRRSVDDYVAAIPAPLDAVAAELRRVVRAAAPEALESVKWGQPVYDVGGPFAALKAYPKWITLTFWRGTALPDPQGILAGDGDRMRHARFQPSGRKRHPDEPPAG
jgi:hypothetical protein